MKQLIILSR